MFRQIINPGPQVVFSILVATLLIPSVIEAANYVTLKAWASEEYLKERARNPNKKAQTYNFMEGHKWTGNSVDKGLEKLTFEDLILDLAPHLVKQNFYPNPVRGEGDLLIVVHYGATDWEQNFMSNMGISSIGDLMNAGLSEMDALDTIGTMQSMYNTANSIGPKSRRNKASILGIDEVSFPAPSFSSAYEYEQMLRNARYFVVLMAFDYAHLRQTDEAKLLWSTRYNIRTSGQNFETAIKQMNEVASSYFGINFKKLMRMRRDDKSRVVIGEIEVIEEEG